MADNVYIQVNFTLGMLVQQIALGTIGLPDIQRPFVWPNVKVRDLFDSMYRGYPVGYLLFWQNGQSSNPRAIGTDAKQVTPNLEPRNRGRAAKAYVSLRCLQGHSGSTQQLSAGAYPNRIQPLEGQLRSDKCSNPS